MLFGNLEEISQTSRLLLPDYLPSLHTYYYIVHEEWSYNILLHNCRHLLKPVAKLQKIRDCDKFLIGKVSQSRFFLEIVTSFNKSWLFVWHVSNTLLFHVGKYILVLEEFYHLAFQFSSLDAKVHFPK